MKLSCPACGAEIAFRSRSSVFGVCSFCKSTVVRQDVNLETLGKMAELPADMSPIQIGTRGKFESKNFEILGRIKVGWEDGNWNEWYALFDDGRDGWLAEAQGFYMMSFQMAGAQVPQLASLVPGMSVSITAGPKFEVTDIKEATCVGSEGELPKTGVKGKKTTSVDLNGPDGRFACIEYAEEVNRLYVGKYVDFETLSLVSLREIDGW